MYSSVSNRFRYVQNASIWKPIFPEKPAHSLAPSHAVISPDEYRAKGIEFVPYATPSVEGTNAKYKFGVLDFGGISWLKP